MASTNEQNDQIPFPTASTLATPAIPGFFPKTPAGDAYGQNEGVLEQAGRELSPVKESESSDDTAEAQHDKQVAFGAGLLGAGVGLVLGGPVGAVIGGGLGAVGALEHEGLKHKIEHDGIKGDVPVDVSSDDHAPAAPDATLEKQMHDSPAQRELAAAAGAGTGAAAAAPLSQLLSGGAGAHDLNQEIEEPSTVSPTSSATPAQPESILDMSEAGVATPAVETSEDKKDGLSSNQKLALGAGAGLAAGGLGGAALASRSDDVAKAPVSRFDSPYRTASTATLPGAPTGLNPQIHSSAPAATEGTFNEELPSQTRPLDADNVVAGAAAGTALGAAGATAIESRDTGNTGVTHGVPGVDTTQANADIARDSNLPIGAFAGNQTEHAPIPADQPQTESQAVDPTTGEPVYAPAGLDGIRPNAPALYGAQMGTAELEGADRAGEAQPGRGTEDEDVGKGREAAQAAAGAALGVAGVVGVKEALEAGGGSSDDVEFPQGEDPKASLAAQLAGKNSIPPDSRFYEGTQPDAKPALVSRFSDATVDTVNPSASIAATEGDVYDDQRAFPPGPHMAQRSLETSDGASPAVVAQSASGTDQVSGVATAVPAHELAPVPAAVALANVQGLDPNAHDSTAYDDFAHLSTVPGAANSQVPIGTDERLLDQEGEDRQSRAVPVGAAAAGLAVGAGVGGLAAHHAGSNTVGGFSQPQQQYREASHSGYATYPEQQPGEFVQQGQAPLDHYEHDHNELDDEGRPRDHPHYNPIRKSPHMKIATREDAHGHNRLAKKKAIHHEDSALAHGRSRSGSAAGAAGLAAAGVGAGGIAATSLAAGQHDSRSSPTSGSGHLGHQQQQQGDLQSLGFYGTNSTQQQPLAGGAAYPERQQYNPERGTEQGHYSDDADELDEEGRARDHPHYNPIHKSPHMKIATRKDSIGHNRLAKKSSTRRSGEFGASGSPRRGSLAGAEQGEIYHPSQQQHYQSGYGSAEHHAMEPRGPVVDNSTAPLASAAGVLGGHAVPSQHSQTEGESVWNGAVNHVVEDETAHRGGQRPGLFTIESEVPVTSAAHREDEFRSDEPTGDDHESPHSGEPFVARPVAQYQPGAEVGTPVDATGSQDARFEAGAPLVNETARVNSSTPPSSSASRKLQRNRRASRSSDGETAGADVVSSEQGQPQQPPQHKSGFFSKVFGGGSGRKGAKNASSTE